MSKPKMPPRRQINGPIGDTVRDLHKVLSGVLDQSHIFGTRRVVSFPGAGTSVRVISGLAGAVAGYRVEKSNADVRVFDGTAPAGVTTPPGVIYLQASAAATVTLYLYSN